MRFGKSVAGAVVAALAIPAQADPPATTKNRWHFVFDAPPAFRSSVLFERGEGGDETRLLLEAASTRLVFVSRQSPDGRDSTERVDDPATGEFLERRLLLSGGDGHADCRSVKAPDACIVFRGSGGGPVAAGLAAFSAEAAPALRARIRGLSTAALTRKVLGVAPLFPRVVDLRAHAADFLGLVWPEAFRAGGALEIGRPAPGCAFDAGFGFPCDERALKTEAFRFRKREPAPGPASN